MEMTIEQLVVRFQDRTWKLWGCEASGGLLAPVAKGEMSTSPLRFVERQKDF